MWAYLLLAAATFVIPLGLDLYMPVPPANPVTADKVALGRSLFNDRRLSADGSIACASCHRPTRAFSDGRAVAVGIRSRRGIRNVPALINRGYGRAFSWDGRHLSLEAQVLAPIEAPNEMDSSVTAAAARVGLSPDVMGAALASYVRSILSGDSRFDRFTSGDREALSTVEQQGLQIFRGKGNCTACHVGPTFTDEKPHNTGIAWRTGTLVDAGAGRGAFKTPTLREIARTAPYMHDGSLATLGDVVDFYDSGGHRNDGLDEEIRPLKLMAGEKTALVAFLQTLSGELREGQASVVSK
jgi:cytochrome c peroxidase